MDGKYGLRPHGQDPGRFKNSVTMTPADVPRTGVVLLSQYRIRATADHNDIGA